MKTVSARKNLTRLGAVAMMCGVAVAQPVGAHADARSDSGLGVQPGSLAGAPTPVVPPAVQVPPGQTLIGDFLGDGVQVYRCAAGTWAFVEPAANLVGWTKRPGNFATAVHFRGPSWESTNDGSLVEARVIASSPVPGSIPELLLQATVNRGDGVFGHVSYLQRLRTQGGVAPVGACTDGQTTGVPYRAEYRFFMPAS